MCPDCGKPKMQFETEEKAKRFITFNGEKITNNVNKLRVYYCPSCCCYHITSKRHYWKQDVQTKQLLAAYKADVTVSNNNYQEVRLIHDNLKINPNVVIKKTGQEHITHFIPINKSFYGVDDNGKLFDLKTVQKETLITILKRIVKKLYI